MPTNTKPAKATSNGTAAVIAHESRGRKHTKLGWLPVDWDVIPFGNAFDRVKRTLEPDAGTFYREIGIRSHAKGIFHKEPKTGAQLGDKSVFWVEPERLVVNIVFAWEQAVARTTSAEDGMIASHRFPMYRAIPEVADLDFVLYFLKTKRGKLLLQDASPGGAGRNKTLSQGDLFKSLIPSPPYAEQQRIAAILGTWDAAIAKLEQLIVAKQRRKQGHIGTLLSAKGWKRTKLGELGTFSKGKGITKNDLRESGVPCVTYGELYTVHHVRIKKFYSFIDDATAETSQSIHKGDVLFAGSGETAEEIGKAAVYLGDERACAGGDVIILRPHKIDPLYLAFALGSPGVDAQRLKLGQGHSVVHIYPKQLANMEVPVAPPDQQQLITGLLDGLDGEITLLEDQLSHLTTQKHGLMQQLLTGAVRIKH